MLIGPPRGCPSKAMWFPLKKFHDCAPKAVPLHTNPTDPDPVICGWGPLLQITVFEKNPSMDKRETRPSDCSRGNVIPYQSACILPKSEPEVEPTIWRQPSGRHFTAHSDPRLEISLMTKWRWGEVVVEINCLSLVSAVQKNKLCATVLLKICQPRTMNASLFFPTFLHLI